ncbi:MAG: FtsX-like permease family protein [bacterium]|nr:FtsX-like permease family protein [bacterium]
MGIWRLVRKEMGYRRLNFALSVIGVLVATAGLIAQTTWLRAYDMRTASLLTRDMDEAVDRLNASEKKYREITNKHGFNVRVLPERQSIDEYYKSGYASETMDQDYARQLADSEILKTIRHLAPILRKEIFWSEYKRSVTLIGTHGEVPLKERKRRKKPIIQLVPDGQIEVGYRLWSTLGLKTGQEATLFGRKFVIGKCMTERGSQDDNSVWMDLKAAQEITGMAGKINEIQAVDCVCALASPTKIREELAKILPGTQVTVKVHPAVTRIAVRVNAEQTRIDDLKARHARRVELGKDRKILMMATAAILIVAAAIWISLLAFGNVRQRTMEIGVLRAIGLSGRKILAVFLVRSLIIGLVGAICGVILGGAMGVAVAWAWGEVNEFSRAFTLFPPWLMPLVLLCSPILSAMVSWAPAMLAAGQDPAVVLSRE